MISNGSDIQGTFSFNSDKYSVNDLVTALMSQGISIHKIGPNLKIGQKVINPIANNTLSQRQKTDENINEHVIQGLANQIQRIFSELNKLKDHLGVNNSLLENINLNENKFFDLSTLNGKSQSKPFESKSKWDSFVPSKNFDLQSDKFESSSDKIDIKNDTPIITLGRKKNASLIEEYTDLVTNKGVTDDDALDSLSTKLFKSVSNSQFNSNNQQELRSLMTIQPNDKSPAATTEFTTFLFTKCEQCNSKIPNEAQFCSKCGKKK